MSAPLRIASVNVNGVRAAFRKGMGDWLEDRGVDILALQEVRAATSDLETLFGPEWNILHDAATAKGRAGVAIVSRRSAGIHRVALGADDFDSAGRWIEADFDIDGTLVTVVSTYVHSGEVDTPKQVEKFRFLEAMLERLPALREHNPLSLVVGDLNVGHTELDIKNWKGNVKRAGFLPAERSYFDRYLGPAGETVTGVDGVTGTGLGWVDIGRPVRRPGPRSLHLVVPARPGLRHRHRLAHRLPARHPRARGPRVRLHDRPRRGVRPAMVRSRPRRRRLRRLTLRHPRHPTTPCPGSGRSSLCENPHDQATPVLRHAALRRLAPPRQLHRCPPAVEADAAGARRLLQHRRPARDHGAAGPRRAPREDPSHGRPVHRRRHRPLGVDPVRPVARPGARTARLGAQHDHRHGRGRAHDAVQGQVGQARA